MVSIFTNKLDDKKFVLVINLLFYLFLWIVNPSNKGVFLSFLLLGIFYYIRLRDVGKSLFLLYLSSTIVHTGKTYNINLVSPGFYNERIWPFGYNVQFIITTSKIISVLMGFFIIAKLFEEKRLIVKVLRNGVFASLMMFILWIIFSDIAGSINPNLSLLFSWTLMLLVPVCLLGRYQYLKDKKLLHLVIFVFCSLMVVECVIALTQLVASSPIGKTIERQVGIEYWGRATDEIEFTFRPVGTFIHANNLGYWLSFILAILSGYYIKTRELIVGFSILFGFLALTTTLSRSAWLGVSLGMIYLIFQLKGWFIKEIRRSSVKKLIVSPLTVLLVLSSMFFVFPRLFKSIESSSTGGGHFRYLQMESAITLIKGNPIFGVGTGMNVPAALKMFKKSIFLEAPLSVHNWYALITVENGLPVLFLFSLFIYGLFNRLLFAINRGKNDLRRYFLIGYLSGLLVLLVVGIFQPFMDFGLIILGMIFI